MYRNGAKLIAIDATNTTGDYSVAKDNLTIVDKSTASGNDAWKKYDTDKFEVHWIN